MLIRNLLIAFVVFLFLPFGSWAQVTTSSISGTVRDTSGKPIEHATITAVHVPSGTKYITVSQKGGSFNLNNMRIGGPYQLTVSSTGYANFVAEGIDLLLGETYYVTATVITHAQELSNITVVSTRKTIQVDRSGTSTNISSRQLATLPSISRSISDFTRLTPQANGNSFAGRDNRYNNIQVDGANLNNNFGLTSDPTPGGGVQPISLDAIQQISVNISPYDIRQSGFTGAGISATTKSGDNNFKGTIYGFLRDQSLNGLKVNDYTIPVLQASQNTILGGSLGGPIIKNKLFFFVNGEYEKRSYPGVQYRPSQSGLSGSNVSSTSADSLKKLSDYLKTKFGYDAGAYDNFPNFAQKDHKILAKLDWNISTKHKLVAKYSELGNEDQSQLNNTSIVGTGLPKYIAASGVGNPLVPNGFTRMTNNRFGTGSMSFANSNYATVYTTRSYSLEINSVFSKQFSNQLVSTYTQNRQTRNSPGGIFPTIDILNGSGTASNYITAGMDPFTNNNDVINNVFNITDNATYTIGKHALTVGGSYEYQRVANMFMAGSQSYYVFNSLNDFVTNQAPLYYAYTKSLIPGQSQVYSAELKTGQISAYAEDEVTFNPQFKMSFGIRADKPVYNSQPLENQNIASLVLPDKFGNPTSYHTGAWPTSRWYWSPRVSFRYDVKGDKSLITRGGLGIFTGRIPFVWLTNMPTNSFMYQSTISVSAASQMSNYLFSPNPDQYSANFSPVPGVLPSGAGIVLLNPNWKFPQVFRTNLAFDQRFGNGFVWGMEMLFTKDINAVWMRNANQAPTNGNLTGPDTRPIITGSNKINTNLGSVIVLENTNKGGAFSYTTSIGKEARKGFYGSLAYTYTAAFDVTANPGSTASSIWNSNPTTLTQNDLQLSNSQYAAPHRIVANLSYRLEYLKHLATTVSIFYQAASQGSFSYVYSGDVNGDGNNTTDLMYIPKNPSEIKFVSLAATSTAPAYTAQQQSDAFFKYIAQDKYLKKHMGQYAGRNATRMPFYHRMDMRILQDIFSNVGKRKHNLQISLDILNCLNLFNKSWGIQQQVVSTSPLIYKGLSGGQPTFVMRTNANGTLMDRTYIDDQSTNSTWGAQIGLRYSF